MGSNPPIHICIGAARTGTTWLYEALRGSGAVFVPCVKEVRYWSMRRPPRVAAEVARRRRAFCGDDPEQLAWLERWLDAKGPDADDYRHLMAHPTLPSMDITPGYMKTPEHVLAEVSKALGDTSRVMMIVRNPYERACSAVRLHAFVHGFSRGSLPDVAVRDFLNSPGQMLIRDYASVVRRWSTTFSDRFGVFDFADLQADPVRYLEIVAKFLDVKLKSSVLGGEAVAKPVNSSRSKRDARFAPGLTDRQCRYIAEISLEDARAYAVVDPGLSERWTKDIEAVLADLAAKNDAEASCEFEQGKLLRVSENLGGTTEFARLQRHFGYEPKSLLRWSQASPSRILEILEHPSQPIGDVTFDEPEASFAADRDWPQFPSDQAEERPFRRLFHANLKKKPCLYVLGHAGVDVDIGAATLAALRAHNQKHLILELTPGDGPLLVRLGRGHFRAALNRGKNQAGEWLALLDALASEAEIKEIMDGLFN